MRKLSVAMSMLWLAGCASGPSVKKTEEPAAKPTYTEKIGAIQLEEQRANNCPKDRMYEKEDWRKVVGYASSCVKAKEWNQLEKIGTHLAKTAPLTPWGAYYLSLVATTRKDYPRAQWMLELALKKAPNEGLFHYELGRLFWEMGDEAAAIKEMKQASDLNPALLDAHFVVGQLALRRDDLSEARKQMAKILAVQSRHSGALHVSAQIELKARDYVKAEEYLARAISANPRSSKARYALAQIQETHLKKSAQALQSYRDLRQLGIERKLDESVTQMNLEEKIQTLEKSLSTVKAVQVDSRKPSGEKQVKK